MYESTININILKGSSQNPLNFLSMEELSETTTITGTISGVINITGVWVNNTLIDKVVSTIDFETEIEEVVPPWIVKLQEKAVECGLTIYISTVTG